MGGSNRAFQSTLWAVVLTAKEGSPDDRREALGHLIEIYWKPVYYFIRRKANDPDKAKDLTQGFFSALLERDDLKYVDRKKGRFRTFLMTDVDHFLVDTIRREKAQKRGGQVNTLQLDFMGAESQYSAIHKGTPEQDFKRQWAFRVLAQALADVEKDYARRGKVAEFEALRFRLSNGEKLPYAKIAAALGVTETDVKNRARALDLCYQRALYAVVRDSTESDEEAREELLELFGAFQ